MCEWACGCVCGVGRIHSVFIFQSAHIARICIQACNVFRMVNQRKPYKVSANNATSHGKEQKGWTGKRSMFQIALKFEATA